MEVVSTSGFEGSPNSLSANGGKSNYKFILIVAIVALVAAGSIVVLFAGAPTFQHQEPDPWAPPPDEPPLWEIPLEPIETSISITTDTTWNGRNEVIDRPYRVVNNSTLTIVDSNLTVRWVDLLIWNHSLFSVEPGASLEVIDSTINVVRTPGMEMGAYFGFEQRNGWMSEESTPVLSRVTNLMGTVAPVLSFDVSWWLNSTDLMVVGHQADGNRLELLDLIEQPEIGKVTSHHYQVSLDGLGDGIVRIAITPANMSFGGLVVTNVHLTDGDGPFPNDFITTGDPLVDGWLLDSFESVVQRFDIGIEWQGIIEAHGDVEIRRSEILGPTDVPHWMRSYIYNMRGVFPEGYSAVRNVLIATMGGHISTYESNLVIEDSTLSNVPIVCEDSDVSIDSSKLSSEGDVLTLWKCSGKLTGTVLTHVEHKSLDPLWDEYIDNLEWEFSLLEKYQCGINIYGSRGTVPFQLNNVSVSGGEIGVHLNQTNVSVSHLAIDGTWSIGLWDHDSTGVGDWRDAKGTLSISDCQGHRYMRTETHHLEYNGPHLPPPEDGRHYWGNGFPMDPGTDELPPVWLLWAEYNGAVFYMPVYLVESDGEEILLMSVTLYLETDWGGIIHHNVTSDHEGDMVTFPGYNPHAGGPYAKTIPDPDASHWIRPGNDVGLLNVSFNYEVDDFYDMGLLNDTILRVYLDGNLTSEIDILNGTNKNDWNLDSAIEFPVEHGPHYINWTISTRMENMTAPVEVDSGNFSVFRAKRGTPQDVMLHHAEVNGSYLILDPGVDLNFDDTDAMGTNYGELYYYIDFITYEDNNISIVGTPGSPTSYFLVGVNGPANVTVEGLDCDELWLDAMGSNLNLINSSCQGLFLYLESANVYFENVDIDGYIDTWFSDNVNCTITFVNCSFNLGDGDVGILMTNTDFQMIGCTIESNGNNQFVLDMWQDERVLIQDCTFLNTTLFLSTRLHRLDSANISVLDCSFTGINSYLSMMMEVRSSFDTTDWVNYNVVGDFSGNIFNGPTSGLIANSYVIHNMVGNNSFYDGASLYASYFIRVLLHGDEDGAGMGPRGSIVPLRFIPTVARQHKEDDYSSVPNYWRSFFYMVEVTDGTNDVLNPDPVTWSFRDSGMHSYLDRLLWFGQSTPLGGTHPYEIPEWDDIVDLITDQRIRLLDNR